MSKMSNYICGILPAAYVRNFYSHANLFWCLLCRYCRIIAQYLFFLEITRKAFAIHFIEMIEELQQFRPPSMDIIPVDLR